MQSRYFSLGARGERAARRFLERSRYLIWEMNHRSKFGEIDIIALEGDTICFVEVKTRRSDEFAPVIAAVDIKKQRQITRTAKMYRRIFELEGRKFRFDVVTVLLPKHSEPVVEIVRSFWDEGKFRKRRWDHGTWPGHN